MAAKLTIHGGPKVRSEPFPPWPAPGDPSTALRAGLPCPVADRLAGELFALLVHPTLTTADLDDAVQAIEKVVEAYRQEAP
jgi:dTDP-4-amino-4,6-dideoxygalactose transaminase